MVTTKVPVTAALPSLSDPPSADADAAPAKAKAGSDVRVDLGLDPRETTPKKAADNSESESDRPPKDRGGAYSYYAVTYNSTTLGLELKATKAPTPTGTHDHPTTNTPCSTIRVHRVAHDPPEGSNRSTTNRQIRPHDLVVAIGTINLRTTPRHHHDGTTPEPPPTTLQGVQALIASSSRPLTIHFARAIPTAATTTTGNQHDEHQETTTDQEEPTLTQTQKASSNRTCSSSHSKGKSPRNDTATATATDATIPRRFRRHAPLMIQEDAINEHDVICGRRYASGEDQSKNKSKSKTKNRPKKKTAYYFVLEERPNKTTPSYAGNTHFRTLIDAMQPDYFHPTTTTKQKIRLVTTLVHTIREMRTPPGRFLYPKSWEEEECDDHQYLDGTHRRTRPQQQQFEVLGKFCSIQIARYEINNRVGNTTSDTTTGSSSSRNTATSMHAPTTTAARAATSNTNSTRTKKKKRKAEVSSSSSSSSSPSLPRSASKDGIAKEQITKNDVICYRSSTTSNQYAVFDDVCDTDTDNDDNSYNKTSDGSTISPYRMLIGHVHEFYNHPITTTTEKQQIVSIIVKKVRASVPPGRFLVREHPDAPRKKKKRSHTSPPPNTAVAEYMYEDLGTFRAMQTTHNELQKPLSPRLRRIISNSNNTTETKIIDIIKDTEQEKKKKRKQTSTMKMMTEKTVKKKKPGDGCDDSDDSNNNNIIIINDSSDNEDDDDDDGSSNTDKYNYYDSYFHTENLGLELSCLFGRSGDAGTGAAVTVTRVINTDFKNVIQVGDTLISIDSIAATTANSTNGVSSSIMIMNNPRIKSMADFIHIIASIKDRPLKVRFKRKRRRYKTDSSHSIKRLRTEDNRHRLAATIAATVVPPVIIPTATAFPLRNAARTGPPSMVQPCARIEELTLRMKNYMQKSDERFTSIGNRLDRMNSSIPKLLQNLDCCNTFLAEQQRKNTVARTQAAATTPSPTFQSAYTHIHAHNAAAVAAATATIQRPSSSGNNFNGMQQHQYPIIQQLAQYRPPQQR